MDEVTTRYHNILRDVLFVQEILVLLGADDTAQTDLISLDLVDKIQQTRKGALAGRGQSRLGTSKKIFPVSVLQLPQLASDWLKVELACKAHQRAYIFIRISLLGHACTLLSSFLQRPEFDSRTNTAFRLREFMHGISFTTGGICKTRHQEND